MENVERGFFPRVHGGLDIGTRYTIASASVYRSNIMLLERRGERGGGGPNDHRGTGGPVTTNGGRGASLSLGNRQGLHKTGLITRLEKRMSICMIAIGSGRVRA